ncbi:MAG: SpoIIE family protein phosphatase [Alphaproteobacteria bacterium]|nr:SpoIIE family protein phosphatase [Alphaproteobacteria bacterium]
MHALSYSATVRSYPGEELCGDAAFVHESEDRVLAVVSDGLGHGPRAHAVSQRIEDWIRENGSRTVADLIGGLHDELRGTVGAAIGLCALRPSEATMEFVGVGNIVACVFGRGRRELISQPGTLGLAIRTVRVQTEPLTLGDVVVLHSDGISSTVNLREYPDILAGEPSVASHEIVRRFGRKYDDVSCLVVKCGPQSQGVSLASSGFGDPR